MASLPAFFIRSLDQFGNFRFTWNFGLAKTTPRYFYSIFSFLGTEHTPQIVTALVFIVAFRGDRAGGTTHSTSLTTLIEGIKAIRFMVGVGLTRGG